MPEYAFTNIKVYTKFYDNRFEEPGLTNAMMLHLQKIRSRLGPSNRRMLNRITRRQQRKSLKGIAVYLLLILYVAGTSQLEVLHCFVHHHQSQAPHVFEQQMDACDLSIYLNDVENGCHHDSHLVVSDKCDMCDLAYHGDQTILTSHVFSTDVFSANYFEFYKSNLDSYWAVISSSRAPPARA